MSELRRIGEIIDPALSRLETSDGARAYGLWARAAGGPVAANARPRRFARGLLTLECASSVWANELTYLAPQILARMSELDPDGPVRSLRFVTARTPFAPATSGAVDQPPDPQTGPGRAGSGGGTRQGSARPTTNPEGRERHRRDAGTGAAEEAARQVGDDRLRTAILGALERSPLAAGRPAPDDPDVNPK